MFSRPIQTLGSGTTSSKQLLKPARARCQPCLSSSPAQSHPPVPTDVVAHLHRAPFSPLPTLRPSFSQLRKWLCFHGGSSALSCLTQALRAGAQELPGIILPFSGLGDHRQEISHNPLNNTFLCFRSSPSLNQPLCTSGTIWRLSPCRQLL